MASKLRQYTLDGNNGITTWGYIDVPAGTVTSVAALTLGTTGTDLTSSVANGTTAAVITLNVPTASASNRGALSSADWSTFNAKQSAISLGTGVQTALGVNVGSAGAFATAIPWANYTPTVTLVGGAGNTVPVYSTNTGRWMQVGKMVFVRVYLTGDGGAEGAGTGQLTIALPVTVGASSPGLSSMDAGAGLNNATVYQLWANLAPSATTVGLSYWATVSSLASMTGADQNNATRNIVLNFCYEVD